MYLLFFLLWILLTDRITLGVCLTGAVVSALFCLFSRKVLGYEDHFRKPDFRRLWGSFLYLGYLLLEILKASLVVMKLVYTKGKDTKPVLVYFHTGLQSDEARAALANSITLTAGTITVQAEDDVFCVHSLDRSLAEGIENSTFEQRLAELER